MPQSYWLDLDERENFRALTGRRHADVVVIGAGITGLTTATLRESSHRMAREWLDSLRSRISGCVAAP